MPNVVSRDPQIDFLRGLAILIIYIDHISGNRWGNYTPRAIGFSDMAEVLLLVSGYVGGMVYSRRLSQGFVACQLKSLRRCAEIYFAHIVTVTLLCLFTLLMKQSPLSDSVGQSQFHIVPDLSQIAFNDLADYLLLINTPAVIAILPLYISFLVFLPATVFLANKNHVLLLVISLGIYLLTQIFPETFHGPHDWYFNPFSWQLLFCFGCVVGMGKINLSGISSNKTFLRVCAVALTAVAIFRICYPQAVLPFNEKPNWELVRIVYFFFLALFMAGVLPRTASRFWGFKLVAAIRCCGRQGLVTYCAGGILSFFASCFIEPFAGEVTVVGELTVLAVNIAGLIASYYCAYYWEKMKRGKAERVVEAVS